MLPDGADAVVRVEEAVAHNGWMETEVAVATGRDIRRAGEDIRPGDTVLTAGTVLGPAEMGVLSCVGRDPVACRRSPRVAVVVTGDEVVDATAGLGPGAVRDANGVTVPALARSAGAQVTSVARVGDDVARTRAAVAAALDADVAVICGGVSVGPHDHVRRVLAELGAEQRFWGVALRPGRPTWFGRRDRAGERPSLVFGLPGNPVSAMVTFLLFARPALRALAGADPRATRLLAALTMEFEKAPGRAHAVRVALRSGERGLEATPTRPEQASHILTSMVGADGLAILPAERERIEAGESVEVEPIAGPWVAR
jgi:molybdopterin molybdotransferase